MTSHSSDVPLCDLSFHRHWTPLNQIFFSQCIQDSDEERNSYSQRKKWKRKRHHGPNEKIYKDYIIYKVISSSESEVSASDECSVAGNYEVVAKGKKNQKSKVVAKRRKNEKSKVVAKRRKNEKSKRNRKKRIPDKPNINSSDENNDPQDEGIVRIDDDKSCTEPKVHTSDELSSANKLKRNMQKSISGKPNINSSDENDEPQDEGIVGIDADKSCSEPESHTSDEVNSANKQKRNMKKSISDKPNINSSDENDEPQDEGIVGIDADKSCSEPEGHMSDELNSANKQKRNMKRISDKPNINSSDENDEPQDEGIVGIDVDKSCSEPEGHTSDEVNSANKQTGILGIDADKSCSEPEVHMSDEVNSADGQEKSVHCKQSAGKNKKNSTEKNESSDDDLEIGSNNSDDHYDVTDPSNDKKNNLHHNQPAAKYKKNTIDESESFDDKEILSNTSDDYDSSDSSDDYDSSDSSDDYDSSDSSDDYEVEERKKKYQKSKKALEKNSKHKSPQLSEYEKMIQKNRAEKMAFMESIKLLEAKEDFKEALKSKTDEKKKRRRIFQNPIDRKVCRQSIRQKDLLKEKKKNLTSSLRSYNELHTVLSFEEKLKKGYEYRDFISEDNDSECKISPLLDNDYVSRFEKMTLQESIKIPGVAICSMSIHESQENIIICYGLNSGEIIFWHVNSGYDFSAFQLHLQKVTCLKFNPYLPNVLISTSIDGTMYEGDFERKVFYQIFKAECCNHFDFLSPSSYLVAHGIGYVSVVDNRTSRKTFEKRHKCNEDAAKTVSLHPVNKNHFISAHQKGFVRLWDLRKLQINPVMEVDCKGKNLISSSFSPVTGDSILTTISDSICLIDSSFRKKLILKKSIEHNNYQKGWAPFQATWLPNTEDAFVVGSQLNPRKIEIYDDKLCNIFNFTDERLFVIGAVNAFHSSLPLLASASKKRVFIFSESE